ncbi:hypothetical protein GRJ2_001529000 [Grus japonensis]|uniref:Uncharacterized protein n=1 Tax=Grus japonensis TaxID=30415 RepID=A0ABC9WZV3_GRUJA
MPGAAGTPPAAPPAAAAVTCTLKSGKILIIPAAQHPASLGEEVQQQRLSLRRLQQQSQAHCNPIMCSNVIASQTCKEPVTAERLTRMESPQRRRTGTSLARPQVKKSP